MSVQEEVIEQRSEEMIGEQILESDNAIRIQKGTCKEEACHEIEINIGQMLTSLMKTVEYNFEDNNNKLDSMDNRMEPMNNRMEVMASNIITELRKHIQVTGVRFEKNLEKEESSLRNNRRNRSRK